MCVCLYVYLCACVYVCLCMPYAMGTCRDQMTTFGSVPFLSKWVPGIELRLSCLAELSLQLNLFSFWKLSVKLVSALLPGRWSGSWRAHVTESSIGPRREMEVRRDTPMKVNKKKYTPLIELWLGQEKGSKKLGRKPRHWLHYMQH